MSSSAALASAAELAMSTAKPISPSFDFKMPESRSSSSMTRRRNDNPPPRGRRAQAFSQQSSPKFKTVLAHHREAPRAVHFDDISSYAAPGSPATGGKALKLP